MKGNKSVTALAVLGMGVLLVGASFADAARRRAAAMPGLLAAQSLAERLELTDIVLFTEARYTRNPAVSDRFSAFQDHPMALEHFPSGSVAAPPSLLKRVP